jgi:hypothetical protein
LSLHISNQGSDFLHFLVFNSGFEEGKPGGNEYKNLKKNE